MIKKAAFLVGVFLCALGWAQSTSTTTTTDGPLTIPSERIDTRKFYPAIDETWEAGVRRPSNPRPAVLPNPGMGGRSSIIPGRSHAFDRPASSTSRFPGIGFTFSWPPDTHMAVGPNHVMMAVNTDLAFFTKAGVKQVQQGYASFFTKSANDVFDPKVIYDRIANRWVTLILVQNSSSATSEVALAISDDNDPNGTWYKYTIDASQLINGVATWGDYPGFGYNKDAYVITLNQFGFNSGSQGVQTIVIRKSSILTGGSATVFKLVTPDTTPGFVGGSLQVAEVVDPSVDKVFMVNATRFNNPNNRLQVWTLSNLASGTPTQTNQLVNVPNYDNTYNASARSNGLQIDGLDGRIINVYYRNNKMYAVHTVNDANPLAVRWYQFAVDPAANTFTLEQSGNITDNANDFHMGSIAASDNGRVGVVFSRSGTTTAGDILFANRQATDTPGSMSTPQLLETSAGSNYNLFRWGDYAAAAIDPVDGNTFWVASMTVSNQSAFSGTTNTWTTHFSRIEFAGSLDEVTLSDTTVEGGNNLSGTVRLTSNAPTGGTTVNLADNSTFATVPPSVMVPAGNATANFTVSTSTVTSNQSVTVTASLGGENRTANFTIIPRSDLQSISASPNTVLGGQSTVGTVNLTSAAPAGGAVIVLSDNSANLTTPPTVTVASGQTSATFSITTTAVASRVDVTVSAVRNGITRTTTVTVTPIEIASFVMIHPNILSGTSGKASMTLNGPAPSGFVVTISDDSTLTTVPSSLTVPVGLTTAGFLVTAGSTMTDTTVRVTISREGVSRSATTVVRAPDLLSFTVFPNVARGGQIVNGAVALTVPAPTGGLTVQLTYAPLLTGPATVLIPAASRQAPFFVRLGRVNTPTLRTMTATYDGVTMTNSVLVMP